MNNIVDVSDFSHGSHIEEYKNEIISLMPTNNILLNNAPTELSSFDKITKQQTIRRGDNDKYLRKCIEKVKHLETKDKYEIIKDIYLFVLKLHMFHKYIFNCNHEPFSEQDYIIKVWSPMFEILFRSTVNIPAIITHWRDTTPENI